MFLKFLNYLKTNLGIKKLALKTIKFYQKYISGILGKNCRFYPTCSQYTYQAIEKHGTLIGIFLGTKRILKCHPFSKGGYDPVPEKIKTWRKK